MCLIHIKTKLMIATLEYRSHEDVPHIDIIILAGYLHKYILFTIPGTIIASALRVYYVFHREMTPSSEMFLSYSK